MAYSIEDVNSRTILQQFHALYEKQDATDANVENLDTKIDQEIQDRTSADIGLSEQIGALQSQLDSLGTIFKLKGSVATVDDLPSENNHVGDVWYVQSVSSGYIWIDDNGTERWEQLGLTVDLSNYPTNEDLSTALARKQDTLTAGTNVSIINNVISASAVSVVSVSITAGGNLDFEMSDGTHLYTAPIVKKYYVHCINKKMSYGNLSIKIITNDSTPFTLSTLEQWLYDNGFSSNTNYYECSVINQYGGGTPNGMYILVGLYSSNGTTLSAVGAAITQDAQTQAFSWNGNSAMNIGSQLDNIIDTVIEL